MSIRNFYDPWDMLRIFNDSFNKSVSPVPKDSPESAPWRANVDVSEDDKAIYIHAELPGVKKEDIKIDVHDGYLKISGEKTHQHKKEGVKYYRLERSYGKFERSFQLPENVKGDNVQAAFKDGILDVTIPKPEPKKPSSIQIQ
eukprot:TRINITY_DN2237_c0_g1_i3.p1 TRINITY_DN2237_c0_g1~~TRINITY_DN2237_c0_g1_i3.p1  ORF type:complete len:143 (-),score=24.01 TRINITY_DN2237_c0_g1_i3:22-450(-)